MVMATNGQRGDFSFFFWAGLFIFTLGMMGNVVSIAMLINPHTDTEIKLLVLIVMTLLGSIFIYCGLSFLLQWSHASWSEYLTEKKLNKKKLNLLTNQKPK